MIIMQTKGPISHILLSSNIHPLSTNVSIFRRADTMDQSHAYETDDALVQQTTHF